MHADDSTLDETARKALGDAEQRLITVSNDAAQAVRHAFERAATAGREAVERHMATTRARCAGKIQALVDGVRTSQSDRQRQLHRGRVTTIDAFGRSLCAAQTSGYRMFVKRLRRGEARVTDALRHGRSIADNAVAEARVRWELHLSLARTGQAPAPTPVELERTVMTACEHAVDEFASAVARLTRAVESRLLASSESFVGDIATVTAELSTTLDSEIARTLARVETPDANADGAVAAIVVTMAGAGAAVTFGRDLRGEVIGTSALGGAVAAITALLGRMAANMGNEAPLLEGWKQTVLRALPGGVIAGAGSSWVAAPWFVQLLSAATDRFDAFDRGPWGVVARGLIQTGEVVVAQASSRACVAAAVHGLATLNKQSLVGTPFDPVSYGSELFRHAFQFAVGDARDWLELQHDPYEATP